MSRALVGRVLVAAAVLVLAVIRLDFGRAVGLGFELDGQAYGVPATYHASQGLRVILMDARGRRWETVVQVNGGFRLVGWRRPHPPLAIALCDPARPAATVPMLSLSYSGTQRILDGLPPHVSSTSSPVVPNAPCGAPAT